jgi:hypothetical protein
MAGFAFGGVATEGIYHRDAQPTTTARSSFHGELSWKAGDPSRASQTRDNPNIVPQLATRASWQTRCRADRPVTASSLKTYRSTISAAKANKADSARHAANPWRNRRNLCVECARKCGENAL